MDGETPKVLLKGAAPPEPPAPLTPSGASVDLFAYFTEVRAFGGCPSTVDRDGGRPGPCGFVLSLPALSPGLDALSYAVLRLRGEASGPVTLALADRADSRREDNVPLAEVQGRFDLRIPLAQAARRLDPRYLAALVALPKTSRSRIVLAAATLERAGGTRQGATAVGFWLWEYREALARGTEVLDACRRYGCTRLSVQMPALEDPPAVWDAYVLFLAMARNRGIEALALDGYPEAIHDPKPLIDKLQRLLALQPPGLAGVQLDIEPYLLPEFSHDPEAGFARYLAAIERVKAALAGRVRLSVVMPFWLTAQTVRGRPVAFSAMDLADEAAVMSYRTDPEELRAIATDTLRYGDLVGVPVWLAVETVPLPLERHQVLKPEPRRELADAYLDRRIGRLVLAPPGAGTGPADRFRLHHRITVRSERITFAGETRGRVRAAVATLAGGIDNPSLAGVLIHDLDHFLALPE